MEFFASILFLIIFYLRPQEWVGFLANAHLVSLVMIFAVFAMFAKRGIPTLRDLIQTPHDWVMLAYVFWILHVGSEIEGFTSQILTYLLTYIILVQALSDFERVQRFLWWWTVMIIAVAAMALLPEIGIDPTHSHDLTYGRFLGRLSLNTSMTHNPNSLAHSVVPAIPLAYFLWFWRRRIWVKEMAIPITAIPVWCVYATQSKGAYLAGFATLVLGMIFGRPKLVQITILILAGTIGWAGLQHLPRMAGMGDLERDEGVLGRKAAFEFGLAKLEEGERLGWRQFQYGFLATHGYEKASHSSYNQVGAELGYPGLFLFIGMMYCCLRTVATAKAINDEEERAKRMLFVLVVSFAVSSWMIDFATRNYFFMFAAVASAFHRHLLTRKAEVHTVEPAPQAAAPPPSEPVPASASATVPAASTAIGRPSHHRKPEPEPEAPAGIRWRRLGWIDFAIMYGLLLVTVRFWHYILEKI